MALNRIVEALAAEKGLEIEGARLDRGALRRLLADVLMVGVAMGMTSEEPITHLEWFAGLLEEGGLDVARHVLVMSLPGSYLDRFAQERGAPSRPLQLDGGTGTPGRFSAPSTRVFLLPAALLLTRLSEGSGRLREALRRAWQLHDFDGAVASPASHPFVELAASLDRASSHGICRLEIDLPHDQAPILPWIEQLMEESLGKGGKGVLVFEAEDLDPAAPGYRAEGAVHHELAPAQPDAELDRIASLAACFLGWQLTTALYAYLNRITFAGQPAVEEYKERARELRRLDAPLDEVIARSPHVEAGGLILLVPNGTHIEGRTATEVLAAALLETAGTRLDYLDVTFNGEPSKAWEPVWDAARDLGNRRLGVPVKIRRAPAAYHATEQSEMDGPPHLISLRIITRRHEETILGRYDDRFLQAQAVGTWQAMAEAGRRCFLLVVDGHDEEAGGAVLKLVQDIDSLMKQEPRA